MTPDPELGFVREILLGFKTSGTFVMPPGRRAQVVEVGDEIERQPHLLLEQW